MRILLTNYLKDGNEAADINKLQGGPIASARSWFDEWVGVEASALDDAVIERLRPRVYLCMAEEEKERIYMKVHDAWGRTDRQEGLFPADVTAGVVYILRNPLDLVRSCACHWGISMEKAVENLCNPDFALLGHSEDGIRDQLSQKLGSWTSHTQSWLDESGLPCCLVRYEDLLNNPEKVFGDVIKFCGLPFNKERVRKAVAFSSFSELQRQEREKGFKERSMKAEDHFFRRGKAGSWREELSPDLAMRLIESQGKTMRRFGYLDENNHPV